MNFETLSVTLADGIATIELNRPDHANAMSEQMWMDIREAFRWVDETMEARVAIISGGGRHFSAGIDLAMLAGIKHAIQDRCDGRARDKLRRRILELQDTLTSIERCRKPVLAAIHGACIGAAVDLVTCCDMRYASADAYFSIREIDVGMTADVGTLQRMPKLVPDGIVRELAYTGRRFDAAEARQVGLLNRVCQKSPSPLPPSRRCPFAVSRKWWSIRATIRWPVARTTSPPGTRPCFCRKTWSPASEVLGRRWWGWNGCGVRQQIEGTRGGTHGAGRDS